MNRLSRSVAAGAAALVAMTLCYGGARALLARPHQSVNQSLTGFTDLEREAAERICLRVQADGCPIWAPE
jgi:hypothetical protein